MLHLQCTPRSLGLFLILFAGLFEICISATPRQDGSLPAVSRRAVVARATSDIDVDGSLIESAWEAATALDELVQREPREGEPPTEKTRIRLLYDRDNFYIGVDCYDSSPADIIATQMSRDADIGADDRIEILLDTFRDRRNAFYFATNPAGALIDGLIIENRDINREWDAVWHVRTRRVDGGWTAEFAIPFKSLGFNSDQPVWGFNFSRTIMRKIEEVRWASARLDIRFLQVSEAGELTGFSGLEQGAGLDVRPYISGNWRHESSTSNDTLTGDSGGELFYNITTNLKLTTTFNTDFGETEVDARQINLTRFPLFFPEKRAFFLENAAVFSFAGSGGDNPDVLPFFSRRIGLIEGRAVPILAGAKLTGKADRYDVGLLTVRTREAENVDAKNFTVARVKRNILQQSYIGGIFTSGNPAGPGSSQTLGADLRLATSQFLGGRRNFDFSAYFVKTRNPGVQGDTGVYGLSVNYPNDLWDAGLEYVQVQKNFNPALGFVSRPDTSKLDASINFAPRPRGFLGIRQMLHQVSFRQFNRLDDGRVESWRLFTAPVNWTWDSGDRFELNWRGQFERLLEPFEIFEGITLSPGDYRFDRFRIEFWSSPKRPLRVETTWWLGTYWSGRADELSGLIQYKFAPHFQAGLSYEQTFARLPQGNFAARIFSLRADYSVTPFLTFFNLVQFDNESQNLGWQNRIRWIFRPGQEMFIVLNQGWTRDVENGRTFHSTERSLAAKLQYTFRF